MHPTVTRVNSASITTGAYPESHGLLGNSVFFPKVEARRFLDTADRANPPEDRRRRRAAADRPDTGSPCKLAGRRLLVVSSDRPDRRFSSTRRARAAQSCITSTRCRSRSAGKWRRSWPAPSDHSAAAHSIDTPSMRSLKAGLPRVDPAVTVMWLSRPRLDGPRQGHRRSGDDRHPPACGCQHPAHRRRPQGGETLRQLRYLGHFDHGFSTYTGAIDLCLLSSPFAASMPDGLAAHRDRAAAPSTFATATKRWCRPSSARCSRREARVRSSRGGRSHRRSRGRCQARCRSARCDGVTIAPPRFSSSPDRTDARNARGFQGSTASSGVAGHGSASP